MILSAIRSQLIVVDMQERLLPAMAMQDDLLANVVRLNTAAQTLAMPITISQQYPRGLGASDAQVLASAGAGAIVLDKTAFSCARDEALRARFSQVERKQIVLCGIEAHICVLQTALDLAADLTSRWSSTPSRREPICRSRRPYGGWNRPVLRWSRRKWSFSNGWSARARRISRHCPP